MRYCLYDCFDDDERRKLESQRLYVYDFRLDDNGVISTIEPHVWINNAGNIITNEEIDWFNTGHEMLWVDFEEFCSNNEEVDELSELTCEEV